MSSVSLSQIRIEDLRNAALTNEEIVALLSFICSAESVTPYSEHVKVLRDKYDMTVDVRPLEIEVLKLRTQFPTRTLRNFYEALGDQGYHSLIAPLMTYYQEDPSAALYAQRLEEVFGIVLDDQFLSEALRLLDDTEMEGPGIDAIDRYFRNKLDRVAPYAPIPSWIKNFDINVERLPRLRERELLLTSDLPNELIADYLLTQVDNYGLVIEPEEGSTEKDVLINMLEQMTPQDKEMFTVAFRVDREELERIQNDPDIARVYGPVNPYSDTDFSVLTTPEGEPDTDLIYGGARMFTDMSIEYDYDNDRPLEDWFRGYCLQCSRRIRSYHHAVRVPRLGGGWLGCYDSWECAREFLQLDEETDPSRYNLHQLKLALLDEVAQEIQVIGIADRDYQGTEDEDEDEDEESAPLPIEAPIGERPPIEALSLPTGFGLDFA